MVRIRPMRAADLFAVSECNRKNLPENYQAVFLFYVVLVSPGACFVAESAEGRIVGYAIGKPRDELEEKEPAGGEEPIGYLTSLAVDKSYRGKGVGRALMAAALHGLCALLTGRQRGRDGAQAAEPAPSALRARIFLNVRESNLAAIALYTRVFQFERSGVSEGYYANREAALVMSRVFSV